MRPSEQLITRELNVRFGAMGKAIQRRDYLLLSAIMLDTVEFLKVACGVDIDMLDGGAPA